MRTQYTGSGITPDFTSSYHRARDKPQRSANSDTEQAAFRPELDEVRIGIEHLPDDLVPCSDSEEACAGFRQFPAFLRPTDQPESNQVWLDAGGERMGGNSEAIGDHAQTHRAAGPVEQAQVRLLRSIQSPLVDSVDLAGAPELADQAAF